jgi:NAD(P)-dependent dehydrogenase (short-subunit alcohol dehydrogenase family)
MHFQGLYDGDQQQLDLRATNSWVMPLEHVSLPEAVEVQAINVLAPFILNSKLKPLLLKSGRDTYIVNVSAMEGQFYRYVSNARPRLCTTRSPRVHWGHV